MKKRHTAEQIVAKLREAEVELAKGKRIPEVVRKLGLGASNRRFVPGVEHEEHDPADPGCGGYNERVSGGAAC